MINDDIQAVEQAAAVLESSPLEPEEAATSLQTAVAAAVTHGKSIRDVAAAAHMTALEVLDAADAVMFPHASV
jgi:hypothetical protein